MQRLLRSAIHIDSNQASLLRRGYFTTPTPQLAKKTGNSAFDTKPRPFSKSQLQRNKERYAERLQRKEDPRKQRNKLFQLKKQIDSQNFKDFIQQTDELLTLPIQEMMLPDGVTKPSNNRSAIEDEDIDIQSAERVLNNLRSLSIERKLTPNKSVNQNENIKKSDSRSMTLHEKSASLLATFSTDEANKALQDFCKGCDYENSKLLYNIMNQAEIPIQQTTLESLLKYASVHHFPWEAKTYFNKLIESKFTPSIDAWTYYIVAESKHNVQESLKLISQLKSLNLTPTAAMCTSVLESLIRQDKFSETHDFWCEMHDEGPDVFSVQAFTAMMKYCGRTAQVERAFFYYDEMTHLNLTPDVDFFNEFIRAAGSAPHWVNGYEDSIVDVLVKMEGLELMPSVETYNSIICAFRDARDPIAAEFYFWEMKRKGFQPTEESYTYLMSAYGKSQSVGDSVRGSRGRYRPINRMTHNTVSNDGSDEDLDMIDEGEEEDDMDESTSGDANEKRSRMRLSDEETIDEESDEDADTDDDTAEDAMEEAVPMEYRQEEWGFVESFLRKCPSSWIESAHIPSRLLEKLHLNDSDLDSLPSLTRGFKDGEGMTEPDPFQASELAIEDVAFSTQFEDPFHYLKGKDGNSSADEDAMALAKNQREVIGLLDGILSSGSEITSEEIDRQWDRVYFGRPPAANYELPLGIRRIVNIHRSNLIWQEARSNPSLRITTSLVNSYLSVYSEAVKLEESLSLVHSLFHEMGLLPNAQTMHLIIALHLKRKEVNEALAFRASFQRDFHVTPMAKTMGMLIQSTANRRRVTESLQLLEEAKAMSLRIPPHQLISLRTQCKSLGITHPDLPEDPNRWMKQTKESRRKNRKSPQNKIQVMRKGSYN